MLNHCFCLFSLPNNPQIIIRTKLSLQNLSFNKKSFVSSTDSILVRLNQLNKKYQLSLYFQKPILNLNSWTGNSSNSSDITRFNLVDLFNISDNWRFLNFLPPRLVNNNLKNTISLYVCSRDYLEKLDQRRLLISFLNHSLVSYRRILTSLSMSWFVNLYFIGVGYKIFVYNDYLYIRLGFSRMIKIKIPNSLHVLTRYRNNIKLISSDLSLLNTFVNQLLLLRIFNPYKGKGIYQLADFSDIKLKVGKKQQFF